MDQKKHHKSPRQPISRRRKHHLRVPVFGEERAVIERQAKKAGFSVAHYLRDVWQGNQIKSRADFDQVHTPCVPQRRSWPSRRLFKTLAECDDKRTAHFDTDALRALLRRIETTQEQMRRVMKFVIQPKMESTDLFFPLFAS